MTDSDEALISSLAQLFFGAYVYDPRDWPGVVKEPCSCSRCDVLAEIGLTWIRDRTWCVYPFSETHPYRIDIIDEGINCKIVETEPGGMTYRRSWAYPKHLSYSGRYDLPVLAFIAEKAKAWGGNPHTEPEGWIRTRDGRYGGYLAEEHLEIMTKHAPKLPLLEGEQ